MTQLQAFGNFLAQSFASHMRPLAPGVYNLVELALWQHRQAGYLDPPPNEEDLEFAYTCLYLDEPHFKEAGIQR